jgi:hypothetical protein
MVDSCGISGLPAVTLGAQITPGEEFNNKLISLWDKIYINRANFILIKL